MKEEWRIRVVVGEERRRTKTKRKKNEDEDTRKKNKGIECRQTTWHLKFCFINILIKYFTISLFVRKWTFTLLTNNVTNTCEKNPSKFCPQLNKIINITDNSVGNFIFLVFVGHGETHSYY